jgi:hypothetical protein
MGIGVQVEGARREGFVDCVEGLGRLLSCTGP